MRIMSTYSVIFLSFPPYRQPSAHTTHKTSNVNYLQSYFCLVDLQRKVKWPHSARILVMFEIIGHKLGLVACSLTIEKRIYKHQRHILCLHTFYFTLKIVSYFFDCQQYNIFNFKGFV